MKLDTCYMKCNLTNIIIFIWKYDVNVNFDYEENVFIDTLPLTCERILKILNSTCNEKY